MRLRSLAVLVVLACSGLAGCGGDDEFSTAIPKSTPDLTIPTATSDTPPSQQSTPATTTATTGTTAAGATAPPAVAAQPPAPPAAPVAPSGSATTGGQAPQAPAAQSTTGGAPAGEFNDFCQQNPGVTTGCP